MITRRIKATCNCSVSTRLDSVRLVKGQIADVRFESQKELDSFMTLGLFEFANGKQIGLPMPDVIAPPAAPPVIEAEVSEVPIESEAETLPADDQSSISSETEAEVDVPAETEAEVDVPAETESIEDAIDPVADTDNIPDGPALDKSETKENGKDKYPRKEDAEVRSSGKIRRRLNLKKG